MRIKEYQEEVDQWIKTVGVRYFNELTNLGILMEESGELARVMVRKFGEQSSKDSDLKVKLEEEIGDVLFVLTCIANQTGVDLEKVIQENFAKKNKRDQTRHLNNEKLK
jgi:NTP pyrophosphatase (non-canonical NTP hydrolase)